MLLKDDQSGLTGESSNASPRMRTSLTFSGNFNSWGTGRLSLCMGVMPLAWIAVDFRSTSQPEISEKTRAFNPF